MIFRRLLIFFAAFALIGCKKHEPPPITKPDEREHEARALFEKAERDFHLPSADARGAERMKLLDQAAAVYADVLKRFPDRAKWAAQAQRSLANVRAEQGRVDEAVTLFEQVSVRFPDQEWEILQAWKTAGDVLWDANRHDDAKNFYKKIVARFDKPNAPPIYKTVVAGAKSRLRQ